MKGIVIRFFHQKGYGFIKPEGSGDDHFFHISDVNKANAINIATGDMEPMKVVSIEEGAEVEYEISADDTEDSRQNAIRINIVGDESHYTTAEPPLGSWLYQWSFMPLNESVLGQLSEMALPECWEFREPTEHPYPVLNSYLRFTFAKLRLEGNVFEDFSGKPPMAAFNTGLVSRLYEPILAVFTENRNPDFKERWHFEEFCIAGKGYQGKEITRRISPPPTRARYFDSISELLYTDPDPARLQLDWDHILINGLVFKRFPDEFIERFIPADFYDYNAEEYLQRNFIAEKYRVLRENNLDRMVKSHLDEVIKLVLKRVEWNFKTAVPMWYPAPRATQLLLPMPLVEDTADVALVVEKTPVGGYIGHTVLLLDWAYKNARLVCRPDSDWLKAETLVESSVAERILEGE